MTFDEAKQRTADDLRKVAQCMNDEAEAIASGDLQRMEVLLEEKLPLWFDMLALRYAHVCEEKRKA